MPEIEKAPGEVLIDGRWFSTRENEAKENVCVIGDFVSETYFPYESPIGQTIEIGGQRISNHRPACKNRNSFLAAAAGNNDQSNMIYMPMGAALKLKPNAEDLFILAVAKEGSARIRRRMMFRTLLRHAATGEIRRSK